MVENFEIANVGHARKVDLCSLLKERAKTFDLLNFKVKKIKKLKKDQKKQLTYNSSNIEKENELILNDLQAMDCDLRKNEHKLNQMLSRKNEIGGQIRAIKTVLGKEKNEFDENISEYLKTSIDKHHKKAKDLQKEIDLLKKNKNQIIRLLSTDTNNPGKTLSNTNLGLSANFSKPLLDCNKNTLIELKEELKKVEFGLRKKTEIFYAIKDRIASGNAKVSSEVNKAKSDILKR